VVRLGIRVAAPLARPERQLATTLGPLHGTLRPSSAGVACAVGGDAAVDALPVPLVVGGVYSGLAPPAAALAPTGAVAVGGEVVLEQPVAAPAAATGG
jgi:hypothetical protein